MSRFSEATASTESTQAIQNASNASSDENRQTPEDVEKSNAVDENEEIDSNLVWWDGDNDPANPLNWSALNKWTHISIISAFTFIVYVYL